MFCSLIGFISAMLRSPQSMYASKLGNILENTRLFRYCTAVEAVKSSAGPSAPEFSRPLNVAQIPKKKPVLCRLRANEEERVDLALRFELQELSYLAANVTLSRKDEMSIEVKGNLEAHIRTTIVSTEDEEESIYETDTVEAEFDTLILNTYDSGKDISLEDEPDYDDEVGPGGEIDVGEIVSQYLALELF